MKANCPYNPAHIMPIDSFLRHLNRCNATNKGQFLQCKFNQMHVIRKQFIDEHYLKCPDGVKKEKFEEEEWVVEGVSRVQNFDGDDVQSFYQEKAKRGEGRAKRNAAPPQKNNASWDSEEEVQPVKPSKFDKNWQAPKSISKKQKPKEEQEFTKSPFNCDESGIMSVRKKRNQKAKVQDF